MDEQQHGSRLHRWRQRARARIFRINSARRRWVVEHPNACRALCAAAVVVALAGVWFVYDLIAGLPDRDALGAIGEVAEGTTLLDYQDKPAFTIPTQYRIRTPLARISPNLKNAIVAVEDVRFYQHDGIDGIRVVGAFLTDLRRAQKAEGASTITQQLARMSFLSPDKTLRRKLREAILAQQIEKRYTKEQILEFYLNKAYFGDGLYGAEAAARGYFGKAASDLSVAEAALLAGLVRAPSTTNPTVNPDRALERRKVVLGLMLENKQIDKAQYDEAEAEPLVLHDGLRRADPTGIHFKEEVRRELVEKFGRDRVYSGRLRVHTTINPAMQKAAEDSVESWLRALDRRTQSPGVQAALIALDAATGEVRAIVGGRDTQSVGLDRALQSHRQPGSAFKPFVYAAALESGYTPATVIDHLDEPITTYKGVWLPEDEHSTASSMTVRTALKTSSNRAAVKVANAIGTARVVAAAQRLGVGNVPNVPSIALGSGDVTLVSMTSAYAAFAQRGVVRDPIFIRSVDDENGRMIFQAEQHNRQAISETTAFLMSSILADVINAGTGIAARSMGFKLPAAGKTGTTNDFNDAWFVGYTPKLVAGVWVGYDEPRTIAKEGFAATVAVPLWATFMKAATAQDSADWFQPPASVVPVEVCRVSGLLPVPGCRTALVVNGAGNVSQQSMVYTEYFARGTEPTATCPIHVETAQPYPDPYQLPKTVEEQDALTPLALPSTEPPPPPPPEPPPAEPAPPQVQ